MLSHFTYALSKTAAAAISVSAVRPSNIHIWKAVFPEAGSNDGTS